MDKKTINDPDPWGRIIVSTDDAFELMYRDIIPNLLLVKPDDAFERFNAMCRDWDKPNEQMIVPEIPTISPEDDQRRRIDTWFIPDGYAPNDVVDELFNLCKTEEEIIRVESELKLYMERGLLPLLKMMFALVAHFRLNNIVWGVGRGSSVSSYVLFLIGVHKIDSIKYGLDISEFLK